MQEDRYHIHLDVFEGPMDLLVHLIRKNEVDIYDIPIAVIADQYLEYVEQMQAMNVDLAGDFLLMAATLMQIKSRMLLPRHFDDEDDDEDPRMEIVRPLAEYLQLKEAAESIGTRHLLGDSVFARSPEPMEFDDREDEVIMVGLFELIDAFAKILENVKQEELVTVTAETVSVKERINQIADILEEKQTVTFTELFDEDYTKMDMIVTFLALLEMTKLSIIKIAQHLHSGIIRIFYA
ncbi:condensin subunit ScpA [Desulfatibacillum alkenivorans DSM 16219]|jgi:segregation and condensation protein A|uniref:Segregation and condensation protein A n=1 Tax=Desulfatibacillum alkenivorans DSM 16219 TaxID=1121393 RepID=A0A1M6C3T1_9BACT|nr:segregation/condensation protein A [Desulfatibacillum alkenivorans]SHI55649.1 condensin subunit ScpA [Desulfatibacillum alkenivorans DSM 16219]